MALPWAAPAASPEMEPLINALIDVGVLKPQQADEVRAKLDASAKTHAAQRIELNEGITKLRINGEMRLRYNWEERQNAFDQYDGARYQSSVSGDPNRRKGDKVLEPNGADNRDDVSRMLYRLRIGMTMQLSDLEFGLRLVSGQNAEPIVSSMDTYGDAFGKDGVYLDQAYLKWTPRPWLQLVAGKFDYMVGGPMPLFVTTEMYWDPDVTVEGAAETLRFDFHNGRTTAFLNLGQFIFGDVAEADEDVTGTARGWMWVDDNPNVDDDGDGDPKNDRDSKEKVAHDGSAQVSNNDGWLFAVQAGAHHHFATNFMIQAAAGFWYWANSGDLADGQKTKSTGLTYPGPGSGNNLGSEFEIVDFIASSVWRPRSGWLKDKPIELHTHLIYNLAPAPNLGVTDEPGPNTVNAVINGDDVTRINGTHVNDVDGFVDLSDMFAWRCGIKVGEAVSRGKWEVSTWYQQVGSDAVPDTFNDSETASGYTNHKGVGLKAVYAIRDYLTLSFNYYNFTWLDPDIAQEVNNGNSAEVRLVNFDLILKF